MKYKSEYKIDSYDDLLIKTGFYISNCSSSIPSIALDPLGGKDRILSLVRKKDLIQTYLPQLEYLNLLKLNFNHIPENDSYKDRYLIKKLEKYFKTFLLQFSDSKTFTENGLLFLFESIGLYKEIININSPVPTERFGPSIACQKFNGTIPVTIKVKDLSDFTCFGVINGTRKGRSGYYYYKKYPGSESYLIDFTKLISYLSLNNFIFQLVQQDIPLVNLCFQNFLTKDNYGSKQTLAILKRLIIEKEPISITSLFTSYIDNESELKIQFSPDYSLFSALAIIFFDVLSIYQDLKYETNFRKNKNNQIATAYITKKNIPLYIKTAMRESSFNNFFKFVEFDKDIDLPSVKSIEKEFQILNAAYFSNLSFQDVKLRFRKLGKHRAGGLYYPSIHTLCVDIHYPDSFIHEYFHMLDDQLGTISFESNFDDIIKTYRNEFLENLNSLDDKTKQLLKGNRIYNTSYYFRRAEIFARCGEIYFMKILNVKSSLLKPDSSFAYPNSQKLDTIIRFYYKVLLEERLPALNNKATS